MALFSKLFKLGDKEMTIVEWTNREDLDCARRAMISVPRNSPIRNELVNAELQVWRLTMAIHKGEGFLKGQKIENTYNNVQDLNVRLGNKLSSAFMEFLEDIEFVKKKSETPSGQDSTETTK